MKTRCWPHLKTWCKRLAFALVAFVTLIALVLAIEGYRAKRAWDAYAHALAARGESLDWQWHVASPAPDDQNLLATPVLADHFGFGLDASASDQLATSPHAPNELRLISDWSVHLRGPGDWREGTIVPLTEWQKRLRSMDSSTGSHPNAELARRYGIILPEEADENHPASALSLLQSRPAASAVDDLRFLLSLYQAELDEIRSGSAPSLCSAIAGANRCSFRFIHGLAWAFERFDAAIRCFGVDGTDRRQSGGSLGGY
jgi:hypothetical protein